MERKRIGSLFGDDFDIPDIFDDSEMEEIDITDETYTIEEVQAVLDGKWFPIAQKQRKRLAKALNNEANEAYSRMMKYIDEMNNIVNLINAEKDLMERCRDMANTIEPS